MYQFWVLENDFYISNEEIHSSENGVVVEFKINVILFMIFLLLIPKLFLSFSALFSNIPSAKLVMQANFKFILIILSHHHLMRFNFQSTRSNFGHLFSNFNAIFLIVLLVLICPVGQSKQVVVVNRANPSAIYREAWQYTLYVLYYYVVLLQGEVEKCSVQSGGGDPVVVFSGVWDCFRWFQYNLVPLGNQNCHTSLQYILVLPTYIQET